MSEQTQTEIPQIGQAEQHTILNEITEEKEDFNIAEQAAIPTEMPSEIPKEDTQQQMPSVSEDADNIIVSINGVWKTIPL